MSESRSRPDVPSPPDPGTRDPPVGNSPPEDDLRSLIAGITRDSTKTADQAADVSSRHSSDGRPGAETPPRVATKGEDEGDAGERAPEGAAEPAGSLPAAAGLGDGDEREGPPERAAEPQRPPRGAAAPEHWSAEDKAMLASLSSDADREKFLSLDKRREAKLQRAAELERDYGEIDQIFTPQQRAILAQKNLDPKGVIKIWHQVELALGSPQHQDDWFGRIIAGYAPNRALSIARVIHNLQADPAEIAQYLNQLRGFANPSGGGVPGAPQGGQNGYGNGGAGDPNVVVHPAVAARLDALEADRQQRAQAEWWRSYEAAGRDMATFAEEKDADGNLLHPYYARQEVQNKMFSEAQRDRAEGKTPDIRELYDRVVWTNPAIREELQASQREAEDRRQAAARKAKAEAAARAGASITGAPSPGQLPQPREPERSIRDDIRAQLARER